MNCATCGHGNALDSVFCTQCATRLSDPAMPVDTSSTGAGDSPPSYSGRSNAVTVLVLGMLSLVVGVTGPIAWRMGKKELDRIQAGEVPPENRGIANAGYICGVLGTLFLGMTLALGFIFMFLLRVSL